jgi:GTP-binding protein
MFLDHAIITVRAGDGGSGHVSFRREKFVPKGGPNGGDGGDGGDIVVQAEEGLSTLYDFRGHPDWPAEPGEPGSASQCHGRNGNELVIRLPPGTMVIDDETGQLIHDLKPGERVVIAKGGRGGKGNEHFKTSTNQAPRKFTAGTPGEVKRVRLELKLIAEIGFVGMPNAGKSTLLKSLTRANPKIANYPFTTLSPQLGIAEVDPSRRVVIADIPGLIEGASKGAGLGHDFLRHIERTKVICHLLDVVPDNQSDPASNYRTIRAELTAYSTVLAEKREIVVLNKLDLIPDEEDRRRAVTELCGELNLRPDRDVLAISGATGMGLPVLLEKFWAELHPRQEEMPGWKTTPAVATES